MHPPTPSGDPPQRPHTRGASLDALISLLADEDRLIAAMAMDELLRRHQDVDLIVAEQQESPDPALRRRAHQMGNILSIRRARQAFITAVKTASLDLWDGILQINHLYNTRMNRDTVERLADDFAQGLKRPVSGNRMAQFMRGESFTTARDDLLGADLYLIEDVLAQRIGAPILLAAAAQQIGQRAGWASTIVLYKGKHCLIDTQNNFLEPAEGWKVTRFTPDIKLHPCGDKDIWLTILCQLYLSAVLEGRVQSIHRVGSILAELSDGSFRDLPFPLGS